MKSIDKLLKEAGISRSYRGYSYFADAVSLVAEDRTRLTNIRKEVYLPVAQKHNESIQNIERDIRTIRNVLMKENRHFLTGLAEKHLYISEAPYPREIIEIFAEAARSDIK